MLTPSNPSLQGHIDIDQVSDSYTFSKHQNLNSDERYRVGRRLRHEASIANFLPDDVLYIIEKVENMTGSEALEILQEAIEYHEDDVNYPKADYDRIINFVSEYKRLSSVTLCPPSSEDEFIEDEKQGNFWQSFDCSFNDTGVEMDLEDLEKQKELRNATTGKVDWELEIKLEAALIHYHSPYPEVRAVTDPFDDPTAQVETIRCYTLALFWVIIGSGLNEFFYHRKPSINLPTSVVQLILYPSGRLWEKFVPNWSFKIRNTTISLNPGPWSLKEQMFASVIYSVASVTPIADAYIVVQTLPIFYGAKWAKFGFQVLLVLSTQCMGFGFAGLLRRFVIYPVRSVWPTILPSLALNRALVKNERKEIINGWSISRYHFFIIVFIASFCYFWLPNYLFTAMSTFNWITWIQPDNFKLSVVTGSVIGLGLNPLPSWDWNIIDYNYALAVPFYSQFNQYIGTVIGTCVIMGLYFTNYKWTAFLPPNDVSVFNNKGKAYEVKNVMTNNKFDELKYQEYGPPFYSAGSLVTYGAFFAIYPFSFIYTFYIERLSIKRSFLDVIESFKQLSNRSASSYHNDPHSRMMSKYKEVPDWYFLIIVVVSTILLIIACEVFPTNTPVWAIVFDIGVNYIFLIPLSILVSVTGYSLGINVLVELVVGFALPGNSTALMILRCLGYNIDGQAQTYIQDQKLAHYAKIPPMAVFRGQLISTVICCFVTLGVINWELVNISGFCSLDQKQKLTCPADRIFYGASIFWGTIGPKKILGGLYPVLPWCFLIGTLLVIPCICFHKYGPTNITRYFQPTLIIAGMINFAPFNLSYYTMGLYFSFAFMFYIKRKYLHWWEKYTYLLTSGLGAGVALSAIIIFFSVQFTEQNVSWWGNEVSTSGIEGSNGRISLLDISSTPDGYFGPRKGEFP